MKGLFVLTQLSLNDDFHLKTTCQFWEMRLFKTQVCILAATVILLKLRGEKAHGNGTGKCPICRLLTCVLFLVIRHTGSEIKILLSKSNPAVITTVSEVQPDNHSTGTPKEAQRADARAGKAAGGENPGCKCGGIWCQPRDLERQVQEILL